MTTTFRQDFRAGCLTVLTTYQTAHPDLLATVYDYPPESFATPCAYMEKSIPETVIHDSGLRFRVLRGSVVLVTKLLSNKQATHEQDVLVDGIMDAFTATPHAASGSTLVEPKGASDTEIASSDGVRYGAVIIPIEGSIQEGRN